MENQGKKGQVHIPNEEKIFFCSSVFLPAARLRFGGEENEAAMDNF